MTLVSQTNLMLKSIVDIIVYFFHFFLLLFYFFIVIDKWNKILRFPEVGNSRFYFIPHTLKK